MEHPEAVPEIRLPVNEQAREAVHPGMRPFNHPSRCPVGWHLPLGLSLLVPTPDIGRVAPRRRPPRDTSRTPCPDRGTEACQARAQRRPGEGWLTPFGSAFRSWPSCSMRRRPTSWLTSPSPRSTGVRSGRTTRSKWHHHNTPFLLRPPDPSTTSALSPSARPRACALDRLERSPEHFHRGGGRCPGEEGTSSFTSAAPGSGGSTPSAAGFGCFGCSL